MPSGWEVYYVVFLSALLALGIPAALKLITLALSPRRDQEGAMRPLSNGHARAYEEELQGALGRSELGGKINTRFFLAVNAALVLVTLALVLIPCAATLQEGMDRQVLIRSLVAVTTIAGFAALGLLYAAKKGDLSWIRDFQAEAAPENGANPAESPEREEEERRGRKGEARPGRSRGAR
jgi:NADH:ubiquinone oxidoreductase subunit 3 (subunit A)